MENLVALGTILSAHGIQGEMKIRLQHNLKSPEDFRTFFMLENGLPLPFEVEQLRSFRADIALLSILNINSKEETVQFNGKTIYVDADSVEIEDDWKLDIGKTIVFTCENKVGTISEVIESGLQELLEVSIRIPEGKIRIPAEETFFIEMPEDNENEEFIVELPEGYWDTFFEATE